MFARILPLLLIAAPAIAADASRTPQCVSLNRVQEQRIVDGRTIAFKQDGRWLANDVGPNCAVLKPGRTIQSRTPTSRLCAGDIINVSQPSLNVGYGSCTLGEFTEIAKPAPRAAGGR